MAAYLKSFKNDGFLSNYEQLDIPKTLESLRKAYKGDGDVNMLTASIVETKNVPSKYLGKKPSDIYELEQTKAKSTEQTKAQSVEHSKGKSVEHSKGKSVEHSKGKSVEHSKEKPVKQKFN